MRQRPLTNSAADVMAHFSLVSAAINRRSGPAEDEMTEAEAREIIDRYKSLLRFVAGERAVDLCTFPVDISCGFVTVERTFADEYDGLSAVSGGGRCDEVFEPS